MLKRLAAAVLYNGDLFPPRDVRRVMVRANQFLFERGYAPPWVWSSQECRDYWASRADGLDANEPSSYSGKSRAIVGFLDDFWRPEVDRDSRVLEVGCNAGANLYGLHERGYRDLSAVEINPHALDEMRVAFPDLAASITLGPVEETLPAQASNSADVVFSMAVLIHIHPASNQVFEEMVRVARRYVCVIEAESTTVAYIFARNYRRVFERLGCTEVRSSLITEAAFPDVGPAYSGYTARLFEVP